MIVGDFATNCYLLKARSNQGLVIDPGAEGDKILEEIRASHVELQWIILTHGHVDHIGAVDLLKKETGAAVMIHQADAATLVNPERNLSAFLGQELTVQAADRLLSTGELLTVDPSLSFEVLHTPGHSQGGICLYHQQEGILFSGDTIFALGIGRTDFPYSDQKQLLKSIQDKLLNLPAGTKVYPGHGPETTIGDFKDYYRSLLFPQL